MEEKEIEIDFRQLMNALFSRLHLIVAVTLLFGAFAFVYSKFAITPMYTARSTMYVNNQTTVMSNDINQNEISASSMVADVFVQLIKSNTIMNEVLEQTGLDYTAAQLSGMIHASSIEETPIMSITVTTPNPKESVMIANALLDIAPEKVIETMDGGSAKIIDRPEEPTRPSSPNVFKNTILGLMAGFALSAGLVLFIEFMDTRIKDEEQIRNLFDLPVLGTIPEINIKED